MTVVVGAFDFETPSVDVATTDVVQVAFVSHEVDDFGERELRAAEVRCYVPSIPIGATAIHGIKAEDVADRKPFVDQVPALCKMLVRCDYVTTFNGLGFDVPILERFAALAGVDASFVRARHIDCYRLWKRVQSTDPIAACHSGGLAGAHWWATAQIIDGAHDALNDCRATLRVRTALQFLMQASDRALPSFVDACNEMVRLSALPLPGYADVGEKFKWVGDVLTVAFGRQYAGVDVAEVDAGFFKWMLDGDFSDDTKRIARSLLAGVYPARRYEDEV